MIKIFKCSRIYPPAYEWFKNLYKTQGFSYNQHWNLLMKQRIQWSDYWKHYLELTGKFAVDEVVFNADDLQKCWCRESGFPEDSDLISIVIEQAKKFNPDIFFAHNFPLYRPDLVEKIRMQIPNIKLWIGWDGIAINDCKAFEGHDMVFSCADFVTEYYVNHGKLAYTIPFGFDERILAELGSISSDRNPSFLGTLHLGARGHNERTRLLYEVAKAYELDLYISMPTLNAVETVKVALGYLRRMDLATLLKAHSLNRMSLGPRFGLEMFRAFASSSVSLNAHIDAASNFAGNIRLFDTTGVGSCLLTDARENIRQFFEPDLEVVVYRSPEECLEKLRWLREHPRERRAIADAAQKRVLREHSYQKRMEEVADILFTNLNT